MNDLEQIRHIKPCANGCIRKGTEDSDQPQLLAARHGHFCNREYMRTHRALGMVAPIIEHVITLVAGIQSKRSDGAQRTKGQPPLPLNVEAFNDANETYRWLVYWCAVWATRLNRVPPAPAAKAWRDGYNRIVGLPDDIQPAAARYATGVMATWLSIHLEDILSTDDLDTIRYFVDDPMRDIYRLDAKWPREDQAQYAQVHCWIQVGAEACKARIVVYPPQAPGGDEQIRCENGHIFPFDEFDRMSSVFRQVKAEETWEIIKSVRTQERLARKYGGAA